MKNILFFGLFVCILIQPVSVEARRRRVPSPTPAPEEKCTAKFVDGIAQGHSNCTPMEVTLGQRCELTINRIIYPGSEYDSAEGRKRADAELKRTVDYYAKYCIDIKIEEITFTVAEKKKAKDVYEAWISDVIQNIGGKDHLGKTTIGTGDRKNFKKITEAIQQQANDQKPAAKKKLVVVFMNEYIGGADGRDTLVSSCQESMLQIGINWVDSKSSYILAHELIHAIGKPSPDGRGSVTWSHDSKCKNALSTIERKDSRQTIDLSDRFLDVKEYEEFGTSLCAKLLDCHKIK